MIEVSLEFRNKNNQKIVGKAFVPDGAGSFPAVIFSHGFGSNFRELMHHGEGFAENGIVCVFFDFCGGGLNSLSDGKMTEMTPLTEVDDLTAVLNEVANLPYVDPEKIFLQGESMGGLVSAYVAAHNADKVKGLILWYPAFVIPDDAKRRIAAGSHDVFNMPIGAKYDTDAVSMGLWTEIVKYRGPVHIIHGDDDLVVPIIYSEKANHLYSDCYLTVIPGAGHGYNDRDSVTAMQLSIDFVRNILNEDSFCDNAKEAHRVN